MPQHPPQPIVEPLDALRSSQLYDGCSDAPQVTETHISYLFLTDKHVYKLKKPVDFGFLDYSTVEKRHVACQDELEINRKLAPDVYQEITAIGRDDDGHWRLGQDVEAKDWLVKMRRLPADRCLESMIEAGTWSDSDLDAIVSRLAKFYQSLEPIKDLPPAYLEHVVDNQRALENPHHDLDANLVRRVHAAQRQFLFFNQAIFDRRMAEGRIVEGHGDLRADHVYVTDPPVVIDGIEFSRELRIVDIADELSFFAMTCEILDAPKVGYRVMRGVLDAMEDQPDEPLLHFYHCYRACVRAKVQALRTTTATGNREHNARHQAEAYLHVADRHATKLHQPLAIIFRGLSGTGKTSLARALAKVLGVTHLSTDQIRDQADEAPNYSDAARLAVYQSMQSRAIETLSNGESVVLDGTFLTTEQMRLATEACESLDAKFAFITCVCPHELAIQRIRERQAGGTSESDANEAVFYQQYEQIESVSTQWPSIELDTTADSDSQIAELQRDLPYIL